MIPRPRVASLLPHSLDLQHPLIRKVRTPGTAPQSRRMVQIREPWIKAVKFFPDPKIALAAMMPLHCFPPQYHQSLLIARPLCQGNSHLKATQPQCTQEKEYPKTRQQNKDTPQPVPLQTTPDPNRPMQTPRWRRHRRSTGTVQSPGHASVQGRGLEQHSLSSPVWWSST